MKKSIVKSAKSIIMAAVVCAGLVLGIVSAVSAPSVTEQGVVATHPSFVEGTY